MPRIDPADADPGTLNVFRTMARNPDLDRAFRSLGGHLLAAGLVPAREREIVILRVGWRCRSEYEFAQHARIGRSIGLTDSEIGALATDGGLGGADRELVAMVDELCSDDAVGEQTWARLAVTWSDEQLLELLVLAGFYRLVSGVLSSVQVALEPGTDGWPAGVDLRRAPRQE